MPTLAFIILMRMGISVFISVVGTLLLNNNVVLLQHCGLIVMAYTMDRVVYSFMFVRCPLVGLRLKGKKSK